MHSRGVPVGESVARAVAEEAWRNTHDRKAFVAGWMAAHGDDVNDQKSHLRKIGAPFIPLPGFDD